MIAFVHGYQAAYSGAYNHPHLVGVAFVNGEVCLLQSLGCGGDSELDKAVQAASVLAVHVIFWIEVFYLTGDLGQERGRVEVGYAACPGFPRHQVLPGGLHVQTQRVDGSHTCDHHSC